MNQVVIEREEVAVSDPAGRPFTRKEKVFYSIALTFAALFYLAFMTIYVGSVLGWFS